MEPLLTALSGLAWTIVYIAAIRIGFKHHTYAIPIAALGLNIAWESIYAIHDLMTAGGVQGYVNLVWACADVVILYTFFRYGRPELPAFVTRGPFIAWGVAVLGAFYVVGRCQTPIDEACGRLWAARALRGPRGGAFLAPPRQRPYAVALSSSRGVRARRGSMTQSSPSIRLARKACGAKRLCSLSPDT